MFQDLKEFIKMPPCCFPFCATRLTPIVFTPQTSNTRHQYCSTPTLPKQIIFYFQNVEICKTTISKRVSIFVRYPKLSWYIQIHKKGFLRVSNSQNSCTCYVSVSHMSKFKSHNFKREQNNSTELLTRSQLPDPTCFLDFLRSSIGNR